VLKDKDGNTIGYQGFNQDITERKQAEEAQQESEETISGIIDSSPFSIQLLDPQGYTVRTNPAFKRLFRVFRLLIIQSLTTPILIVPALNMIF